VDDDQHRPAILTAADLLDRGYSRRAREYAERHGSLTRVRHGVYALGAELPTGPAADEALLELRSRAAALHIASGTALSHTSALVMHGLPVHGLDTGRVVTTRHRPGSGSRRGDRAVCYNADLVDAVVDVDGIPVTTAARTIIDVARTGNFAGAVCAADEALRRDLCTRDELTAHTVAAAGRTGISRARAVVAFADERAESVLESLSRVSISRAGLPVPELQVEFTLPDGSTVRVDMYWDEWQLVAECDGLGKYKVDDGEVAVRRRLRAEKARQNGLESLGLMVQRWQWPDWRDNRIEGIVRGAMRIRESSRFGPRRVG
jgi:predicted transcriptional regulator of viral defense system